MRTWEVQNNANTERYVFLHLCVCISHTRYLYTYMYVCCVCVCERFACYIQCNVLTINIDEMETVVLNLTIQFDVSNILCDSLQDFPQRIYAVHARTPPMKKR